MAVARDPGTGAALLSATANVYNPGTVTPISATIFDKNGNPLSNPLTSDAATGLIDFYLNVAQEVDLVISKSGFTTRTYSNVPVIDDAGNDLTALLTATGQIIYASGANVPAALAIGSTGALLSVTGGIPAWTNTIAAGGLTVTAGGVTVNGGNLALATGQYVGNTGARLRCKDLGTVSNGAAVAVDDVAASNGILFVVFGGGDSAIYLLQGGAHATVKLAGSANFTTTLNNASTVNVYWNTSDYFLQNNTGSGNTFRTFFFADS